MKCTLKLHGCKFLKYLQCKANLVSQQICAGTQWVWSRQISCQDKSDKLVPACGIKCEADYWSENM